MNDRVAITIDRIATSRYTPANLRRPLLLGTVAGIVLCLPIITV